jgi:predicted component of type VI protein secretion system
MTAKLILSMDGVVLHEYPLNKERMTVGRKPHNDIVIDNLAVSGEHAAVVTILNDSFLEDLDSTNGVVVNGAATKKHFLQSNDVIEIGKYKLKYLNEQQGQASSEDFEKTMVLRAPSHAASGGVSGGEAKAHAPVIYPPAAAHEATGKFTAPVVPPTPVETPAPVAQPATVPLAAVQILNGPNAGRGLDLVKNLTTLGKPGVQIAVLTRRPHSYFITHVEGAKFPIINGKELDAQPHQLNNHDIIELVGVKMEFYFKE